MGPGMVPLWMSAELLRRISGAARQLLELFQRLRRQLTPRWRRSATADLHLPHPPPEAKQAQLWAPESLSPVRL